jgi:hypothetical protein
MAANAAPVAAPIVPTPRVGKTKVNPKDGLTYVWIEPGTFMMGCSPGPGTCLEQESQRTE